MGTADVSTVSKVRRQCEYAREGGILVDIDAAPPSAAEMLSSTLCVRSVRDNGAPRRSSVRTELCTVIDGNK